MQPLRDLVLIELEDSVKEEKRPSGLILLSTQNNLYQIGDEESLLQDLINKPKMNKGKILSSGPSCKYFMKGNVVIYKKGTEVSLFDIGGKRCALVNEKNILVAVSGGFLSHPDYVLVKITKEARLALFNKKIKRDDGSEVLLFISADKGVDDEDSSKYFVSCGEIHKVGANINYAKEGDLALISYMCDNDNSIIVGYEGEDKIIAVKAITTRHDKTLYAYGNRLPVKDGKGNAMKDPTGKPLTYNRDRLVYSKGDYEEMSLLYGILSDEILIPIEPYVFLEHEETKVMKVGNGGIIYEEDEKIIKR